MNVYHGTNDASAPMIASKIDVARGGGELGRGFYAGENIALAAAWAQGRYAARAKVVKIEIPESDFVMLRIKTINHIGYLIRFWKQLQNKKQTRHYLFSVDVVVAPFATISFSYQYKFESLNSESVLNTKSTKTVL